MDAREWDERYRSAELVWGIRPNRWVEQELGTEKPGTALDLACGEGRNALWLASLGWQVTAVDFSAVAIDKARTLGADDPRVEWVVADALTYRAPTPVDLVLVCYLQLPALERRTAIRTAAESVAPGGSLLVIGHDSANLTNGTGGPQTPEVLYTPEDVRGDLAGTDLVVTRAESVFRPVEGAARPAIDVLLRARRGLPD
jgi:SAM-dependent methyltransferase